MLEEKCAKWRVKTTLEKYNNEESYKAGKPDDVMVIHNNMLLNEGINALWNLVCGAGGTPFNATNSFIAVGDSTTAAAANQTGLQATTNKLYKAMDAGYPQSGTNQKAVFKSTFGTADANFAWNEWSVASGNSDSAVNLNRKVETMGTKASGSTWVITVEISLS